MPDHYDQIFKALSDASRRRILTALCGGPMVAGDLARLVGLAPNAVSFHLKWLRAADLVSIRREGRYLRYHANPDVLADLRTHVQQRFVPAPVAEAARGHLGPQGGGPARKAPVPPTRAAESPSDELPPELL
jgi:DNA-binding transcriptional ArsR family regulator